MKPGQLQKDACGPALRRILIHTVVDTRRITVFVRVALRWATELLFSDASEAIEPIRMARTEGARGVDIL